MLRLLKWTLKLIRIKVQLIVVLLCLLLAPKAENLVTRARMSYHSKATVAFVHPQAVNRRYGSGFSINYKGQSLVVTNKHVCNAGRRWHKYIYYKDAKGILHIGKEYLISKTHDVCIIKAKYVKHTLSIGSSTYSQQEIFILGHPWGNDLVIRKGYINGIQNKAFGWIGIRRVDVFFLNLVAYPGNSGSAIVNYWGQVVGILFAGRPGAWTETYAVPLKELIKELDKYIESAKKGLPSPSKRKGFAKKIKIIKK